MAVRVRPRPARRHARQGPDRCSVNRGAGKPSPNRGPGSFALGGWPGFVKRLSPHAHRKLAPLAPIRHLRADEGGESFGERSATVPAGAAKRARRTGSADTARTARFTRAPIARPDCTARRMGCAGQPAASRASPGPLGCPPDRARAESGRAAAAAPPASMARRNIVPDIFLPVWVGRAYGMADASQASRGCPARRARGGACQCRGFPRSSRPPYQRRTSHAEHHATLP